MVAAFGVLFVYALRLDLTPAHAALRSARMLLQRPAAQLPAAQADDPDASLR